MRKQALLSITELADQDERVVFIGSDLGPGVMAEFKERHPDRFFMEGVSEQHIIGMAAGMAMEGFIPYVNTIATFLTRRCYEQIAMDVCLHDLPVRLIANGGGMVYAPLGPTHQAIDDFALMRALPNMTVTAPVDANEMASLIKASLNYPKPLYVRLGKGGDPIVTSPTTKFEFAYPRELLQGNDIIIASTGVMSSHVMNFVATEDLFRSRISVWHFPTVSPLRLNDFWKAIPNLKSLVIVEEHLASGGLSTALIEEFVSAGVLPGFFIDTVSLGNDYSHLYGSQTHYIDTLIKNLKSVLMLRLCHLE